MLGSILITNNIYKLKHQICIGMPFFKIRDIFGDPKVKNKNDYIYYTDDDSKNRIIFTAPNNKVEKILIVYEE